MRKLLIANRGEIAVRIARTARAMEIETVLAASEADVESLAARTADHVIVVGPAPAPASYLNQDAIIAAALETGCHAVHPGYGFLSENAVFARKVAAAGLIWVGPDADAIEMMGNKSLARESARKAGVPVLQGSDGPLEPNADAVEVARRVGYPLVVKASAGGGGRGIRFVHSEDELLDTIEIARGEAASVFGDPTVYLERFVQHARHVEVQILGDGMRFIHLGDRDCSMQRRSQKVIEEAPAPDLPDTVRERIRESSVELARDCRYSGAGTVEFLYDPVNHEAAFIEMNTRIQVEHPITEQITGVDLIREQLLIAFTGEMSLRQEDITFAGHAIECRINAEDPENNFFPSPGLITALDWAAGGGIRVDTGVEAGSTVSPYYDSMLAKLIVHAESRDSAIEAMLAALDQTVIEGVKTTIPVHKLLLARPEFAAVSHHSKFIETVADLMEAP
ncbi:acetyl-CoA carboxylase biotin carboxylase subunit [Arthrobacter sp. AL08]|uniref:acetyl-CoA carboxylase biotin carboxylase subunit n=1 Tax=Micrococcaceae TaxID=1268 RepID=UPI001CFFFA3D|nr:MULTISPECIES: acetyl-CoA carboxylase biotin carboxylase subunit [Micrococcaceae]MCB5282807.1 Biotin carboxylase [Arthrobacter sp. ES1]MDI3240211.1 acetyl-CoA carboxylase biotin carboxylase subunit [Arthrobacter sp. AL05]MDI3276221.1 acetyl-CoA carboxylase biotin carboxylase subunit [Arthrobacter sp. AL08]MDJ0353774.1 acetyl-CoA carboxylase biotin carboxylase subunit [Pseudarthrobacter sp. PH31-O2]WGZ79009.1 acetyl-CoA carboxylase biotin carboxylase subunit [Arthrobacter sp. EM1]